MGSGEEHSRKKQQLSEKLCGRNELGKLEKLMLSGLEESSRKVNAFSVHICLFRIKTLTTDSLAV